MRVRGVHHLVVVEGRAVKGLVTAAQLAEAAAASPADGGGRDDANLATAPPDLPVRKAANLLRGSVAGALPVLERGQLVGIVTVVGPAGVDRPRRGAARRKSHAMDAPEPRRVAGPGAGQAVGRRPRDRSALGQLGREDVQPP